MSGYTKYVLINSVDITQYVKNIEISVGAPDSASRIGGVGTATLVCNNSSKIFSPGNTLSTFYQNILGKTVSVFLSPEAPPLGLPPPPLLVFTGRVQSLQAESGAYGNAPREAVIEVSDFIADLQSATLSMPIQYNRTADYAIKQIMARVKKTSTATGSYGYVSGLTGAINDGETVTVNDITYRWKNTIVQANDVRIESDSYGQKRNHCLENLAAAINGAQGEGTKYFASTSRPTGVTASINTNNYYRIVMSSNPTRYYRMNEAAGAIMKDYGENPRDGTYVSSPTFTTNSAIYNEEPYTAPQFGASNYCDVPPIDIKNSSFSVRMWFRVSASGTPANQTLFHIGTSSANSGFVANVGSSGLRLSVKINSTTYNSASNNISLSTWTHLTVSYDYFNQTLKCWLGNTLVINQTGVGGITDVTNLFHIGKLTNGTTYFNGDLSEFSFYYQNALTSGTSNAGNTPPRLTFKANTNGAWANGIVISENSANISRFNLSGGADVSSSPSVSLEGGVPVFDIIGEDWSDSGTNALSAIEELVNSERGFFFCMPGNRIVFRNRDYENRLVTATPDFTWADKHTSLETSYSLDDVYNRIIVTYTPRRTLTEGIIARNDQVINAPGKWGQANRPPDLQPEGYFNPSDPLPPYGTTRIKIPYVDQGTGQICGARSLKLPPEPNVDFTAGDGQNGSGTDTYTTFEGLKFSCIPSASGVDVTIENQALGTLYIHDFQLRGVGIVKYDDVQVERRDDTSITTYGERVMNVSIPIGGTQEYAEALADYLLARFKNPRITVKSASYNYTEVSSIINSAINMMDPYKSIIGFVFQLSDAQLGITNFKGVCVGFKLSITLENDLKISLVMREIESTQAWVLGTHALGTTSKLGV